jgi:nucleoside-diphosphate-sugar epimerase
MIAVTGGTGLLGSHLVFRLAAEKEPVRVLIRPGSDPETILPVWRYYTSDPEHLFRKVDWHITDPKNRASLLEAIQGARQVYHCAAMVSFNVRRKKEIWQSNVTLTREIVNCCLELSIDKLIYTSSVAAVGKPHEGNTADETCSWPVKPGSLYPKTKTLAELEVWRGITEGLRAVIVNPSVILGPTVRKQGSALIFNTINKGLAFYPKGSGGFVDVRDVAEVMVQLGKSDLLGERYILNSANISYRELFSKSAVSLHKKVPRYVIPKSLTSLAWVMEWLVTLFNGKEPRVTRHTARSAHSSQEYSSGKICSTLGFTFRSIDETIRDIAEFYLGKNLLTSDRK